MVKEKPPIRKSVSRLLETLLKKKKKQLRGLFKLSKTAGCGRNSRGVFAASLRPRRFNGATYPRPDSINDPSGGMRSFLVTVIVILLIMDCFAQVLEALIAGKAAHKLARIKVKAKDKKKIKYGAGAVIKSAKSVVEGALAKPLKLIGALLGPVGKPIKFVGTALKAKSVADKAKAIVLTVKKLSRDSVRLG
ncbi:hypothetical protein NPIL_667651 [Nephila pilipes]|uniref:Uncharacterized protein n=1 Tax=Nephila pilipes TaxID=299642 RepID=A0A8X6UDA5_NEPPI|nr:hypothetical protein NPIL_667651 [Nephila pilipes]